MTKSLIFELVLRGIAIGALTALGAGFIRNGPTQTARIVGGMFCLSVIGYAINAGHELRAALGAFAVPWTLLSISSSGFFWLFCVTLFEDRPLDRWSFAPSGGLLLIGVAGLTTQAPARNYVWLLHNATSLTIVGAALYVVVRGWRGDLVEARRRLRGPFLAVVAFYIMALTASEAAQNLGFGLDWYEIVRAVFLAAFCLGGSAMFLESRQALFGAAEPRATPAPGPTLADAATQFELAKLDAVMAKGVWKDEGLTIAALADKVGLPEHRLRRLINDQLGHRNFAAYLNGHRIEAAQAALSDPAQARTTVATIAFDLGYGSLGPFNRAFKEATGATPTEWRRKAQANLSPNSENPS